MSWAERLRASFSTDVASSDVAAMLAATGPLESLRQQLAERRLSARIAHIGEEWRVAVDTGSLAVPLWLGDCLVTLARSIVEAEADSHPDRPGALSPASHQLAAAALQPVEAIVAEASAAAVDATRPPWITSVVMAGPRGEVVPLPVPASIPAGYINGLLLAAERWHGAAGMVLADVTALLDKAPAPAWLTEAIQREKGNLAAGGARLGMLRTRLNALLPDPQHVQVGSGALAPVGADLWNVLNVAFGAGQRLSDPRLLPGWRAEGAAPPRPAPSAPTPAQSPSRTTPPRGSSAPPVAPQAAPTPRQTVPIERARDLPTIETASIPGGRSRQSLLEAPEQTPHRPAPEAGALPEIGGQAPGRERRPATPPQPPPKIVKRDRTVEDDDEGVRDLPEIGPG